MQGLFNFKPSVRPVPLEAHIQGYPGKFYCPRMASMNKPAYAAIQVSRCGRLIAPMLPEPNNELYRSKGAQLTTSSDCCAC